MCLVAHFVPHVDTARRGLYSDAIGGASTRTPSAPTRTGEGNVQMLIPETVTMSGSGSDVELEGLRHEYDHLRSEIELAIRNQVRILGYGGTVLGVFGGLGVFRPSVLILAALPFIAFFFSILWSIEQTRMMRAGDYLSTIEHRLNDDYFEDPVMLWESWLRFRAENQPERDIYQVHYWSQYLIIGTFILAEFIGIVTIWVWQPEALGLPVQIGLTAVYVLFIGIMYYILKKVVKHKNIEASFGNFRDDLEY